MVLCGTVTRRSRTIFFKYCLLTFCRVDKGNFGGDFGIQAKFVDGNLLVKDVITNGAAAAAGVRRWDTIIRINRSRPLTSQHAFWIMRVIRNDPVDIVVERGVRSVVEVGTLK